MRVFHCTRAALAGLLAVAVLTASADRASAQSSPDSAFTIYVRGTAVGNETVTVTESPDGLRLTHHNPVFEQQMKVARDIMKKRRAVLRELAK